MTFHQRARRAARPQPVPGATLARTVLLLVFLAIGLLVLMPLCMDPAAQKADVIHLWVGWGGLYGMCHLWAPRVLARILRMYG